MVRNHWVQFMLICACWVLDWICVVAFFIALFYGTRVKYLMNYVIKTYFLRREVNDWVTSMSHSINLCVFHKTFKPSAQINIPNSIRPKSIQIFNRYPMEDQINSRMRCQRPSHTMTSNTTISQISYITSFIWNLVI